jgi:outer membrane protein assembly factor BamE (lipoprotein component of BamABCDE complex)
MQNIKFLLIALTVLITACTATHGSKVDPEQVAQIKEGTTTEAEIREWFGKPYLTSTESDGDKMLQYTYGKASNSKESYIPYVGAFMGTSKAEYETLAVEINKKGVVTSYTVHEGETESKSALESSTE